MVNESNENVEICFLEELQVASTKTHFISFNRRIYWSIYLCGSGLFGKETI